MNTAFREKLKDKQRIVIKIGSSSLTHPDAGSRLFHLRCESDKTAVESVPSPVSWVAVSLADRNFQADS